jgi:hypothetical protein
MSDHWIADAARYERAQYEAGRDYEPEAPAKCLDCGKPATRKCEDCCEPICDGEVVKCPECDLAACKLCTFESLRDGKRRCYYCHDDGGHGSEKAEAA